MATLTNLCAVPHVSGVTLDHPHQLSTILSRGVESMRRSRPLQYSKVLLSASSLFLSQLILFCLSASSVPVESKPFLSVLAPLSKPSALLHEENETGKSARSRRIGLVFVKKGAYPPCGERKKKLGKNSCAQRDELSLSSTSGELLNVS